MLMNWIKWSNEMLGKVIKVTRQTEAKNCSCDSGRNSRVVACRCKRGFTGAVSSAKLTVNMNTQIHCSSVFKRFANASQADVTKIREDRFEQGTKKATSWAVKVFEGKTVKLNCK